MDWKRGRGQTQTKLTLRTFKIDSIFSIIVFYVMKNHLHWDSQDQKEKEEEEEKQQKKNLNKQTEQHKIKYLFTVK